MGKNIIETRKTIQQIPLEPYSKDMNKIAHAENIMKNLRYDRNAITSTQLRIILGFFVQVKNSLEKNSGNELTKEEKYKIEYIKVRLFYQIAKAEKRDFLEQTYLEQMLNDIETKEDFSKIVDYVEALVAFQRFYINK